MKRIKTGPSFEIETDFFVSGHEIIAGVDEAGRGALAGPLSVALVCFPNEYFAKPPRELCIINDSKLLNANARGEAYEIVKKYSTICLHRFVDIEIIDRLNVNGATFYAIEDMAKAITAHMLLVDGTFNFKFKTASVSVKKGDSLSISIAAASIIAKVERDTLMKSIAAQYPQYNFHSNVGYGSKEHMDAIHVHGPSEIHRRSYEPVKSILESHHK